MKDEYFDVELKVKKENYRWYVEMFVCHKHNGWIWQPFFSFFETDGLYHKYGSVVCIEWTD